MLGDRYRGRKTTSVMRTKAPRARFRFSTSQTYPTTAAFSRKSQMREAAGVNLFDAFASTWCIVVLSNGDPPERF
jgi:hypothetical protein